MHKTRILALAVFLGCFAVQSANAGAPLKGVDVKLGKNPGGNVAARTTDENGHVDFGILPQGSYTLTVSTGASHSSVHLVIRGSATGAIERDMDVGAAARAAPIRLSLNGTTPLVVSLESGPAIVGAVRIKSHSNSTNN